MKSYDERVLKWRHKKGKGSVTGEVSTVGQRKTGFPVHKKTPPLAVPSPNLGPVATGSKPEEKKPVQAPDAGHG